MAVGKPKQGPAEMLDNNNMATPDCPYLGPRFQENVRQQLGADPVLLAGIRKGVKAPMHSAPTPGHQEGFMDIFRNN